MTQLRFHVFFSVARRFFFPPPTAAGLQRYFCLADVATNHELSQLQMPETWDGDSCLSSQHNVKGKEKREGERWWRLCEDVQVRLEGSVILITQSSQICKLNNSNYEDSKTAYRRKQLLTQTSWFHAGHQINVSPFMYLPLYSNR